MPSAIPTSYLFTVGTCNDTIVSRYPCTNSSYLLTPSLTCENTELQSATSCLWSTVPAIAKKANTRCVARRVGREVEISSLELVGLPRTTISGQHIRDLFQQDVKPLPHGDPIVPDFLSLLGNKIRNLSGDVTRGDGIGTSERDPLDSQRFDCIKVNLALHLPRFHFTQLDDTSLGSVIRRLKLGDIDD